MARDIGAGLMGTKYLDTTPLGSMAAATALMKQRQVDAIVRFPNDFSARASEGAGHVQLILHGTDATRARAIQGYVESALRLSLQKRVMRTSDGAGVGQVTVEVRQWFNAANTSTWTLVPGLVVIVMTLVGTFLTALVMAREWERGTLEALFVTPVRTTEILIAKLVPYFCVGMLGLVLCLIAAQFLFKVPLVGSLPVLLLGSMLYLLAALGIGLLISAATKNQFMSSQIALLLSFMPSVMLSDFVFDLRNVPPAASAVAHILPATHFMHLVRTVFLAGDVWPVIMKNGLLLAGYAVGLLILARIKTYKRLD